MKVYDDSELRAILSAYTACGPGIPLVENTKRLMREELALAAVAVPSWQQRWVLVIFASAVLLGLSLFYMLSVGTILHMVVPPQFAGFLTHSLYAFTAAEACLVAGTLMVLYLRQLQAVRGLSGGAAA